MKKAPKKTAKKAAKKKPVSFDDVVDSAPAPLAPVSQAKSFDRTLEENPDSIPEGSWAEVAPQFYQLGTEPGDEEDEWNPVESNEQALGLEATQEPSAGVSGALSQPSLETEPQVPSDAKETTLVHVAELSPFNPDDVDLPVVSPMVPEMIRTISETMRGFKWLYGKAKRKIHLLPEQQGELQKIYGDAEKLLEQLKAIK